jgi:hypothetical protein
MAELSEELKHEVVRRLASFVGAADIVRWLKEEHELETSWHQITAYDPTKPFYRAGDKWVIIFQETRKGYIEDQLSQPIANGGYRLGEMQKHYDSAVKRKNIGQALEILERAAKEVGGLYSNVRNVNVPGLNDKQGDYSPTERKTKLEEIITQAMKVTNAPSTEAVQ